MICVYHHNDRVSGVSREGAPLPGFDEKPVVAALYELSEKFPSDYLSWCDERAKPFFNTDFHAGELGTRTLISYGPAFFPPPLGYVDHSFFLNVPQHIKYGTWLMSPFSGMAHAKVFLQAKKMLKAERDFGYFLNALAKSAQAAGLFCYSEPALLEDAALPTPVFSDLKLFRFVRQHYKRIWLFLLFFNLVVYERKFPIGAFFASFFYSRRKTAGTLFQYDEAVEVSVSGSLDVIIPTIGREKYLEDFLNDLSRQTQLPDNVIIVEQNPLPGSVSALGFLKKEWPFRIRHIFTHRTGACHARNLALDVSASDWVFLADDDIRISATFLEDAMAQLHRHRITAGVFSCLLPDQVNRHPLLAQTTIFGSGCSIYKRALYPQLRFSMALEFGYGEDTYFGTELKRGGLDLFYLPEPSIVHLKAPMGGFRTKHVFGWEHDAIQPKPSPTIMLYMLHFLTPQQLRGYRTRLCLVFYRQQHLKNPFRYLRDFRERWRKSLYLAKMLEKQAT